MFSHDPPLPLPLLLLQLLLLLLLLLQLQLQLQYYYSYRTSSRHLPSPDRLPSLPAPFQCSATSVGQGQARSSDGVCANLRRDGATGAWPGDTGKDVKTIMISVVEQRRTNKKWLVVAAVVVAHSPNLHMELQQLQILPADE